jgi:hypothetical protein
MSAGERCESSMKPTKSHNSLMSETEDAGDAGDARPRQRENGNGPAGSTVQDSLSALRPRRSDLSSRPCTPAALRLEIPRSLTPDSREAIVRALAAALVAAYRAQNSVDIIDSQRLPSADDGQRGTENPRELRPNPEPTRRATRGTQGHSRQMGSWHAAATRRGDDASPPAGEHAAGTALHRTGSEPAES